LFIAKRASRDPPDLPKLPNASIPPPPVSTDAHSSCWRLPHQFAYSNPKRKTAPEIAVHSQSSEASAPIAWRPAAEAESVRVTRSASRSLVLGCLALNGKHCRVKQFLRSPEHDPPATHDPGRHGTGQRDSWRSAESTQRAAEGRRNSAKSPGAGRQVIAVRQPNSRGGF